MSKHLNVRLLGDLKFKENERKSYFSHKEETVRSDHYSVQLADNGIVVKVAPTDMTWLLSSNSHFPKLIKLTTCLTPFNQTCIAIQTIQDGGSLNFEMVNN